MVIYAIPGLGADKRVFEFLDLDYEIVVLDWLEPEKGESLSKYARRMAKAIPDNEGFLLMGVSLGGMIAIEIDKIKTSKAVILISSFANPNEFPFHYRMISATSVLKILPHQVFLWNKSTLIKWFGTKNKKLLRQILDDTDSHFVKWALIAASQWKSQIMPKQSLRIHGDKDRIIPFPKKGEVSRIRRGGHFMIVDDSKQISEIFNKKLPDF